TTERSIAGSGAARVAVAVGPAIGRRACGTRIPDAQAPDRVADVAVRFAGVIHVDWGLRTASAGGSDRVGIDVDETLHQEGVIEIGSIPAFCRRESSAARDAGERLRILAIGGLEELDPWSETGSGAGERVRPIGHWLRRHGV